MPSSIIPGIRYHDARRAIEFLQEAFGFQPHLVVDDDSGRIVHAQLTLGSDMVMIGAVQDDEYGAHITTAGEAGRPTMALYVIVDDVDGHAERARAAGAQIVFEPTDTDYGGRNYTCRDPEGNLWNFGSYDPWAEPS